MRRQDQYLVALDFPGIKNYVFGTDRLVEIRGASALLDRLNREEIPRFFENRFGNSVSRCVFSNGGSAQFIIRDNLENLLKAFEIAQGIVYRKTANGIRLLYGISSLADTDYLSALQRAFLDLETNRNQARFAPRSTLHTGYIRDCVSCSGMASVTQTSVGGSTQLMCETCLKKEKMGKRRGLWKQFSDYFENSGFIASQGISLRPDNFEEIGERCLAKHDYTALVYGDGNAMGRIVKQIDTPERFELFSTVVDRSVREACHEALWKHCKPVYGKIPADILLLGGDDIMVYMSAETAMPFALEIARLFEEKTRAGLVETNPDAFFRKMLEDGGLTISIGIAYGRSHTPISIMMEQAAELLDSAKSKGAMLGDNGLQTPACIDFHFSSRFNQVTVDNCRKHHLTYVTDHGETIQLYQGPYTLDEADALVRHAENLKRVGIASNRLNRLGEAPFSGRMNGSLETLIIYGRTFSRRQKKALRDALAQFGCIKEMPWRIGSGATSTVLVDLIQLTAFERTIGKGDKNASSNPS